VLNFYNETTRNDQEVQQGLETLEDGILMLDNTVEFNQLIQFDLESPNSLDEPYNNHINDDKSIKYFTYDYEMWSDKTTYLRDKLNKWIKELNVSIMPPQDFIKINVRILNF